MLTVNTFILELYVQILQTIKRSCHSAEVVHKNYVIDCGMWEYNDADWNSLNDALNNFDFNVGNYSDIDVAVSAIVALVPSEASKFKPTRRLR